jgi:3-keto-5-aminohexanoate cleavage enzyme
MHNFSTNPGIKDGDLWFANDAVYGGVHNPDQMVAMPVFYKEELVAWTVALVHTTETGAIEPGGMPVSATSRFEEGMNLPPMKIGENFVLREDVVSMFQAFGLRAPQMIAVDLKARYTTADRVRTRLLELCDREGAGHACDPAIYRDINARIRPRCDIVINNSTGGGVNGDMVRQGPNGYREIMWDERLKGLEGGAEMCTLDATTINASFEGRELLMNTPPSRCLELATKMKELAIKPEWEVFSPTHIVQDVTTLIESGPDEAPYFVNLVLGAHRGFQNAMPYSARILQAMVDLLPKGCIFGVSGIGPAQLHSGINSLLLGGHARTGLEDNLCYAHGELATNVRLMERLVRIIRDLGMEPATPAGARAIMGLPRSRAKASTGLASLTQLVLWRRAG